MYIGGSTGKRKVVDMFSVILVLLLVVSGLAIGFLFHVVNEAGHETHEEAPVANVTDVGVNYQKFVYKPGGRA
jgi:hypothetical protein